VGGVAENWSKNTHSSIEIGHGLFEPPWSSMRWLWQLPMVVGVLGVVLAVRGDGGWLGTIMGGPRKLAEPPLHSSETREVRKRFIG